MVFKDNSTGFRTYIELASIGLELFIPIGLGAFLDTMWNVKPWLTLVGIVLGCTAATLHIVKRINS